MYIDFQTRIVDKDNETSTAKQELEYWMDFKERGQHEQFKQVRLLQQELLDMQSLFDEMSSHLTKSLTTTNKTIQDNVNKQLDNQKFLATEVLYYRSIF